MISVGASSNEHIRLFRIQSEVWSIAPHERNVRQQHALHLVVSFESFLIHIVDKPVVAGLISCCELQVWVLLKARLRLLDSIRMVHVYALREHPNWNIGESVDHLDSSWLVVPVVVVEIASTSHHYCRVRLEPLNSGSESVNIAILFHVPSECQLCSHFNKYGLDTTHSLNIQQASALVLHLILGYWSKRRRATYRHDSCTSMPMLVKSIC